MAWIEVKASGGLFHSAHDGVHDVIGITTGFLADEALAQFLRILLLFKGIALRLRMHSGRTGQQEHGHQKRTSHWH